MLNFRPFTLADRSHQQSQNIRLKNTVKKQFMHPLTRFNEYQGKQNQFQHSNLIQALRAKDTVRKQNQSSNQDREEQFCSNHPQRTAEYMVKIDEEMLTYCRKCATQVASQGFEVHKIITSPIQNLGQGFMSSSTTNLSISTQSLLLPSISPSRRRPSFTQRSSRMISSKRSQLHSLTHELKQLKSQYQQKSTQLAQICNTFEKEKQTLTEYYSQLISHIEQIMESHIQAIQETSVNVVQVCEIENGEINETVGEIDEMIEDIEGNFDMIIDQVDQQSYTECYQFYKQKSGIFSHRLQQLGAQAKPWPCTSQEQILTKTHSFKSYVNQLHQVHEQESPNQGQSY